MAVPKVFISSTWYDLRYIRENIKFFVKSLGYEPVLSEEGSIFFDPKLHVQDACVAEVPNCQMLVLIIGGRFGSSFKATTSSVTNVEYREAVRLKIPIFALVEQGTYSDLQVWAANRGNDKLLEKIRFPSVDSSDIFKFIEEVRSNSINNALVPFRDFADIEAYLRQQWAGMMFSFLASANESARVADTLAVMQGMNERIEMLSRQILRSVGTDEAIMTAELYDAMLSNPATRELQFIGARPTPAAVLKSGTFSECAEALGATLTIVGNDEDFSITGSGEITEDHLAYTSTCYMEMRGKLVEILKRHGVSLDSYLAGERAGRRGVKARPRSQLMSANTDAPADA